MREEGEDSLMVGGPLHCLMILLSSGRKNTVVLITLFQEWPPKKTQQFANILFCEVKAPLKFLKVLHAFLPRYLLPSVSVCTGYLSTDIKLLLIVDRFCNIWLLSGCCLAVIKLNKVWKRFSIWVLQGEANLSSRRKNWNRQG